LPTSRPFFGRHKHAGHETFFQIQPARLLEVFGQRLQYGLDDAHPHPVLEAPVDGLVCAISWGQILPGCAGAQNPQRAVQNFPAVAPRSAAPVAAHFVCW
jgi:hypothetical protein